MDYKKFVRFVFVGGFLWTGGLTSIGFYLGGAIPHAEKFLTPIVLAIIFVSLLPVIAEYALKKYKKP